MTIWEEKQLKLPLTYCHGNSWKNSYCQD